MLSKEELEKMQEVVPHGLSGIQFGSKGYYQRLYELEKLSKKNRKIFEAGMDFMKTSHNKHKNVGGEDVK